MEIKKYLERFKNVGTVISVASLVGLLLLQFGVKIDLVWLDTTVKIICGLGIALGVMNNPTTPGLDIPGTNKETEQK